ncbi:MAG: hypothetical protein FWH55_12950, partial [Oscillospiraceae bacterium]|nr:hypothetical protein [Oscillospiraceae bacterium]
MSVFAEGEALDATIDIMTIPGVTAPVAGATPVTMIDAAQYTGEVEWDPDDNPFKYNEDYTATITLTAKEGYTLIGVAAASFSVEEATITVPNAADSGEITVVFPKTAEETVIDLAAIPGVTQPVAGETPVTTIDATQYTGEVEWDPDDDPFKYNEVYTATINLTPKTGYTLTGVGADFFTVAGVSATNAADSGEITVVFPKTAEETVIDLAAIPGVTQPVAGE